MTEIHKLETVLNSTKNKFKDGKVKFRESEKKRFEMYVTPLELDWYLRTV